MLISSVKFFQPIFDLSLCNRISHPKIMGNNSLVRGSVWRFHSPTQGLSRVVMKAGRLLGLWGLLYMARSFPLDEPPQPQEVAGKSIDEKKKEQYDRWMARN